MSRLVIKPIRPPTMSDRIEINIAIYSFLGRRAIHDDPPLSSHYTFGVSSAIGGNPILL
jgi:hypothetical protein